MPLTVKKRGAKYRIVEADTGKIAKNKGGTAMDGGGKASKSAVQRQVRAVSVSKAKKAGHRIPKK